MYRPNCLPQVPRTTRTIIVASLAVVALSLGLLLFLPHLLLPAPLIDVVYDGNISPASRAYRSYRGEIVVHVDEPGETMTYTIEPTTRSVSSPNWDNYLFSRPVAIRVHTDQGGVDVRSTGKTGVDPEIESGPDFVEFTTPRNRRLRISW